MNAYKDPPPPYSADPPPQVHQTFIYAQPTAPPYVSTPPSSAGNYGATQTTVIIPQPEVIIVGACPACRVGVLEDEFSCLGLLCAILFFPAGILCCLLLKEKRCSNCGASFG